MRLEGGSLASFTSTASGRPPDNLPYPPPGTHSACANLYLNLEQSSLYFKKLD
jgi:hypothetical protein